MRIVSLVPSITESLFVLGLGRSVVGRTRYCVHPAAEVAALPAVGGTKNLDVEAIAALAPDLVIGNREENRRVQIEALQARGLRVLVTYPRSPRDVIALLAELAALDPSGRASDAGRASDVAAAHARDLEEQLARPTQRPALRVACLIWKRPYMAVSDDTYAGALIRAAGGANVLGAHAQRYPTTSLEELGALSPDLVLLPSEPYAFAEEDRDELIAAGITPQVRLWNGEDLTWWGVRTGRALRELAAAIDEVRRLVAG